MLRHLTEQVAKMSWREAFLTHLGVGAFGGITLGRWLRVLRWQEGRHTYLPHSHLLVNYSIRFYRFVDSGENIIRPDQEIIPSWSEFKPGRDPVLEWVLKYVGR